jgi:hypothetical protein
MSQRREWKSTIMEVLITVILVALVAILRSVVSRTTKPDGSPRARSCVVIVVMSSYLIWIKIELNLDYKWKYEYSPAWSAQLVKEDRYVAFVPDSDISIMIIPSFISIFQSMFRLTTLICLVCCQIARMLATTFEAAHPESFPLGRQWTKYFANEAILEDYCASKQYPDERGHLLFGIIVHQWDPINSIFDYALRFNSSSVYASIADNYDIFV